MFTIQILIFSNLQCVEQKSLKMPSRKVCTNQDRRIDKEKFMRLGSLNMTMLKKYLKLNEYKIIQLLLSIRLSNGLNKKSLLDGEIINVFL